MPLIKCPECSQDISDQATSCPHCGLPLSPKNLSKAPSGANKVDVNIEKFEITSKKWKKYLMIAVPLLIIGFPLFIFNLGQESSPGWLLIGILFTIVGGILVMIAAVGNWWERG